MLVLGIVLFVLGLSGQLYKPESFPGQWHISIVAMAVGVYIFSRTENGKEILMYGLLWVIISVLGCVIYIMLRRCYTAGKK